MLPKLLAGTNIYFKSKINYLCSLHGRSGALFGFYQECFNIFSTLILIFIDFGAERKHIIFIIILVKIHMYLILS